MCPLCGIQDVCSVSQLRLSLCDPVDRSPPGSFVHGISLGENTGVGCHCLFQGIFFSPGLNLHLSHLLHWQVNSLPLCHLGSLESSIAQMIMWVQWFFLNWRIIALQCCVGFCHTTMWVSRKCTYVPSLLNLPPTPQIFFSLGLKAVF